MEKTEKRFEYAARDLFMLCRRARYALINGNVESAKEILDHAPRIAKEVGIEEEIVRTSDPRPNSKPQWISNE